MVRKPKEGSKAEERKESKSFEKREDRGKKSDEMFMKGKRPHSAKMPAKKKGC